MTTGGQRPLRVVVVGPCASGKTTLVSRLTECGYDAHVVAQEHSSIKDLWQRTEPDVLIALDVSLEVVRQRRSPSWLEAVYERQHQRLAFAFKAADLVIDTGVNNLDAMFRLAENVLHKRSNNPQPDSSELR